MVVPVFAAQQPTPYVITVEMSAVPAGRPFAYGRDLHVVLDEPGWYRGDLHAHTPESSDAWSSHRAMTPREWADACRAIGLDFPASGSIGANCRRINSPAASNRAPAPSRSS